MKACAIVDAYSSGNLLAPAFIEKGYKVIHVRSTDDMLPINAHAFRRDDFYMDIPAAIGLEAQAEILKQLNIEFLLAGCEIGVEHADLLNAKLGLVGNSTKKSFARRNKFEMIETIGNAGLRTARQIKATSAQQATAFAHSLPTYDVILKPQRSAATDLVFRAKSDAEVRRAFKRIMSHKTMFGDVNTEVCVQEFLVGTEYVVDTVSRDGVPVITDIWRYHLADINGVPFLYDHEEFLGYNDPQAASLKQYTLDVINALGIAWGPAHTEIMLTKDGPVVIEVGARLGGVYPLCVRAALGKGPADIAVDAYCDVEAFERARQTPYSLQKSCVLVALIARESGTLKCLTKVQEIKKLASFHHADFLVEPGQHVSKTIDVASSPGIVFLMHDDPAVVQSDYAAIRELEKNGLYELVERKK